jgi:hypothetical protein
MQPKTMEARAEICRQTLAPHTDSGDAVAILSYLGTSDAFDRALAAFAEAHADQNERDCAALRRPPTLPDRGRPAQVSIGSDPSERRR